MFKCQKCSKTDLKPNFVVVERREVDHGVSTGPRGGRGTQIVKELRVCSACLASTPEAPKPAPIVVQKKPKPVEETEFAN